MYLKWFSGSLVPLFHECRHCRSEASATQDGSLRSTVFSIITPTAFANGPLAESSYVEEPEYGETKC